jgi:hypothetical protein
MVAGTLFTKADHEGYTKAHLAAKAQLPYSPGNRCRAGNALIGGVLSADSYVVERRRNRNESGIPGSSVDHDAGSRGAGGASG